MNSLKKEFQQFDKTTDGSIKSICKFIFSPVPLVYLMFAGVVLHGILAMFGL